MPFPGKADDGADMAQVYAEAGEEKTKRLRRRVVANSKSFFMGRFSLSS